MSAEEAVPRKPRRKVHGATVHDVARHAGVSSMTVSRVINDHPRVGETVRRTVEASIAALNFRPSPAARSLASAKGIRIGLPYTNPRAAFNGELLVGALDGASQLDSQLMLERCYAGREQDAVERLIRNGVDGLILPPSLSDDREIVEAMQAADVDWIAIWGVDRDLNRLMIGIDDFSAGEAVADYLVSLGHQRVAIIAGPVWMAGASARLQGFRSVLRRSGLSTRWMEQGNATFDSGVSAARVLLTASERPSAIFAPNDDMAAGAISAAHQLGLKIPADLSIIGFDDTPIATTIWPQLSTVRFPIALMAESALSLIHRAVQQRRAGQPVEPEHRLFDFELVQRQSTAAPKRDG